jgi:K+-sensing histidine kinase KdpD
LGLSRENNALKQKNKVLRTGAKIVAREAGDFIERIININRLISEKSSLEELKEVSALLKISAEKYLELVTKVLDRKLLDEIKIESLERNYFEQTEFILDTICLGLLTKKERVFLKGEQVFLQNSLDTLLKNQTVVAHDTRNFLISIIKVDEMIHDDRYPIGPSEILTMIGSLEYRAESIKKLIGIMASDQIDNLVQSNKVKINDLVSKVKNYYQQLQGKKKVKFDFVVKTDNREIITDERRLNQILTNLINNAIRFSPENGKIIIEIKFRENILEIMVKDFGPGLFPEQEKDVFKKVLKPTNGGHGFGLKIVGENAQLLNGLASYHYDGGAVFKVMVPIK